MCQHCLRLVKYKHVTGALHGFISPLIECAQLHSVHTIHTERNTQCEALCPETPKKDLAFHPGNWFGLFSPSSCRNPELFTLAIQAVI